VNYVVSILVRNLPKIIQNIVASHKRADVTFPWPIDDSQARTKLLGAVGLNDAGSQGNLGRPINYLKLLRFGNFVFPGLHFGYPSRALARVLHDNTKMFFFAKSDERVCFRRSVGVGYPNKSDPGSLVVSRSFDTCVERGFTLPFTFFHRLLSSAKAPLHGIGIPLLLVDKSIHLQFGFIPAGLQVPQRFVCSFSRTLRGISAQSSGVGLDGREHAGRSASKKQESVEKDKPLVKSKLALLVLALLFFVFMALSFYIFKGSINDEAVISARRIMLGMLFFVAGQCAGYFSVVVWWELSNSFLVWVTGDRRAAHLRDQIGIDFNELRIVHVLAFTRAHYQRAAARRSGTRG
jgi:hypothetical protein